MITKTAAAKSLLRKRKSEASSPMSLFSIHLYHVVKWFLNVHRMIPLWNSLVIVQTFPSGRVRPTGMGVVLLRVRGGDLQHCSVVAPEGQPSDLLLINAPCSAPDSHLTLTDVGSRLSVISSRVTGGFKRTCGHSHGVYSHKDRTLAVTLEL